MKQALGVAVNVKLVEPKTIQRSEGKAKRVIDNRDIVGRRIGLWESVIQFSSYLYFGKQRGRLDTVLKILAENDVNIVALSLADTSDYGMLRMIVSDPLQREKLHLRTLESQLC